MKKLLLLLSIIWLSGLAIAQGNGQVIVGNFNITYVLTAPSGACSSTAPIQYVVGVGTIYTCQSGTWTQLSGGGGGNATGLTFGGTTITNTSTAPTSGQCLEYNGTGFTGAACSGGGGDTITSPNSTLNVGGTSANTTLDLAGSAGEIMAGATPALTYTPTLGKSGTAGTLSMFPTSGNFTTTLGSAATASNTVNFFAAVPTNLHTAYCAVASTTCTLTDTGYAYNAVPYADLSVSATNIGTTLNIAQFDVLVSGGTSAAPVGVVPSATSGLPFLSQGSSANPAFAALALAALATETANTFVANVTGSTAAPTAASLPSCSTAYSALQYTSGTGLGCSTVEVINNNTNTGTSAMTLNLSASTTAPSVQLPAVVGGTILAGTSTANLSAPIVIQNTNSSNNNTSIALGISSPGTSTGQTTLNVNGAATGGDLADFGTGGTWASGVLSGQTNVAKVAITGAISGLSVATGTSPPTCTVGTAGALCQNEGTAATAAASVDDLHADSTQHAEMVNNNNTGEMAISRTACVNVTPVTVAANVTTDQNLQACSFNANLLNVVGRTLKVYVAGVFSTAAASVASLTFKVKLCTVSGCGSGTVISPISTTTGATAALTASNLSFSQTSYISTQTAGSSSAYEAHGFMTIDLSSTAATPDSTYQDTNTGTVGTIDSTGALFLQVTVAASAGSTSNSFTERQLVVEVIN